MSQVALSHAFADPARGSQTAFRAILTAMSYPGRIVTPAEDLGPPDGLSPAMAATALTLADMDTPVWLSPRLRGTISQWIGFHCECPFVDGDTLDAAFGLVAAGDTHPRLETAWLDDPKYPDRSTTLVIECASLEGGAPLTLSGPGIHSQTVIAPVGLDAGVWAERARLRPLFPCGVDLILTSGARLMALPRTTLIKEYK
jgi:alpha-D-ribose 1-methylphosphonate 5-triphosphate synthase subunit PhnH